MWLVPLRFKSFAMPRNGWRCANACQDTYCMRRPHGGALRIHPTNNDLKHLCVAAFVLIFIANRGLRFHCGSACCRSGWRLVCCCFVERSVCSSLYFAWTQYYSYSFKPRRHELVLTTKRDYRNFFERQLFKDMYWHIVQLRSVNCFSKIKVKWSEQNVQRHFLRHLSFSLN